MTTDAYPIRVAPPGRVVRVVLERDEDGLTVVLWLVPEGESVATEIKFRGASGVRFLGEDTALTGLVHLLAEDITSRGWEGIRFRVKDSEEELVSFLCRDIEPSPGT